MKPSGRASVRLPTLQVASAACDALGRLALPLAVLGVARGAFEPAVVASVVATIASFGRSWLGARASDLAFIDSWTRTAAAARRRPVAELARRREDEESVAALIQGVWEEVAHRAVAVPQAAGIALTLAVLTASSFVWVGPGLTLVGGALLIALGLLGALLARELRRSQDRAWKELGKLSMSMRLLLEGGLELRAAGREGHAERVVVDAARRLAHHQATATAASLRMGLLPASIALLVVSVPLGAGVRWLQEAVTGSRFVDASVLGAATLATGIAAARAWEQWVTTASVRRTLETFTSAHPRQSAPLTLPLSRPLSEATIAIRGFAHDWGSGVLTPGPLDVVLSPRSGLALLGPNGSGKTTVLLGLLGALEPTHGACEIDGTPACEVDPAAIVGAIGYVPQDPLVMPGETLAWHCRLHEEASDQVVDDALRASGLEAILASRARARGVCVRDLPTGELSGGERRKLALARALQRPRALYVFDEPEASLDAEARVALRATLEELASHARVIVVAHDASTVPESYRRIELGAGSRDEDKKTEA